MRLQPGHSVVEHIRQRWLRQPATPFDKPTDPDTKLAGLLQAKPKKHLLASLQQQAMQKQEEIMAACKTNGEISLGDVALLMALNIDEPQLRKELLAGGIKEVDLDQHLEKLGTQALQQYLNKLGEIKSNKDLAKTHGVIYKQEEIEAQKAKAAERFAQITRIRVMLAKFTQNPQHTIPIQNSLDLNKIFLTLSGYSNMSTEDLKAMLSGHKITLEIQKATRSLHQTQSWILSRLADPQLRSISDEAYRLQSALILEELASIQAAL